MHRSFCCVLIDSVGVVTQGGTTTAGNSSQVSDGAAAVLMTKRSTAKRLGACVYYSFAYDCSIDVQTVI